MLSGLCFIRSPSLNPPLCLSCRTCLQLVFPAGLAQTSKWTLNHGCTGCTPKGGQGNCHWFLSYCLACTDSCSEVQPHTKQLRMTSLGQQLMCYNSTLAYGPNLLCLTTLCNSSYTIAIQWQCAYSTPQQQRQTQSPCWGWLSFELTSPQKCCTLRCWLAVGMIGLSHKVSVLQRNQL